jgi:hypothetical protein
MKIDNKKEIYSFDVEVTKTSGEGKEAKEEKVDHRVFISKPTRRQTEEAELEYSIEISNCLKKGVLTKAMLLKKYDELTGGDQHRLKRDMEYLSELYVDYGLKFQELEEMKKGKAMKTLEKSKPYKEATNELIQFRKEIVRIETEYSSLFDFTADKKAANRQILWYLATLTYVGKDGEEEWTQLVPGETWEDQKEYMYDQEEDPTNEVFEQAFPKTLAFISLWYHSISPTKTDFDGLNDDMNKGDF